MYLDFFGLTRSAFPTAPVSECFFGFTQTQLNLDSLQDGLRRYAGPGILVGPSGTGKTTILAVLEDLFENQHKVIRINAASCTNRLDLIQTILFELGYSYQLDNINLSRLELLANLKDAPEFQQGILLLVDDAHQLDVGALEEIENLSEIYRDSLPTVQMILAGSSSLEERLSDPKLDSLNQKIATRSYLHGVDLCQLCDYLSFQMERAGSRDVDLFSEDAVIAIHNATFGNIRLINQLCDFCLVQAAKNRVKRIDGDFIQAAWSQWQQIPTGQNETASLEDCHTEKKGESIIAFGSLDNPSADPFDQIASLDSAPLESASASNAEIAAPEKAIENNLTQEFETVLSVQQAKANADQMQQKVESYITFAFEQDIQRPKTANEEAATVKKVPKFIEKRKHDSVQREVPAGLMSAWSPSTDVAGTSNIVASNSFTASAPSANDASAFQPANRPIHPPVSAVHPSVMNNQSQAAIGASSPASPENVVAEQAKPAPRRIVRPATDPPVVDCIAKAKKSIAKIDSVLHALDSLDEDWNEVEKVLAESDLEGTIQSSREAINELKDADIRPVKSVVAKSEPIQAATVQSEEPAGTTEQTKYQPLTAKSKEELFGTDNLYQRVEKVLNDVDWTEFLKPISAEQRNEMLPVISVESTDLDVSTNSQANENEPAIQVVPINRTESNYGSVSPNHHPQFDDRRIIQREAERQQNEMGNRQDAAHNQSAQPKLAKRKDLRALLTSLRGF